MDLTSIAPKHLDPRALAGPISRVGERLPAADELVSSVSSTISNVGSELAHQVADLDLPGTVADGARRSRRAVASVVPWMSAPPSRRFATRKWLVISLLAAVAIGVAVAMRRRSDPTEPPARDDWSTGSSNGTTPPTTEAASPARDTASTSA